MARRVNCALPAWALLAGFALASSSAAADPTMFQRATEAMALQRYEAAAKFYQKFIETAAGDPDIPKAQQHLHECTWVECTVPHYGMDILKVSIDECGTQLRNCLFYRTNLTPSVVWVSRQSNFVRCTMTRQDEFNNPETITVALYAPVFDPIGTSLTAGTLLCNKGDVRYGFSPYPFNMRLPRQLWALLPVEQAETEKSSRRR